MGKRAIQIREAEAEAAEAWSWTCQSCDTLVEDEARHCRACAAYWADVASGVFDDPMDDGDFAWCHDPDMGAR